MSKGSSRRPSQVSEEAMAQNWDQAFSQPEKEAILPPYLHSVAMLRRTPAVIALENKILEITAEVERHNPFPGDSATELALGQWSKLECLMNRINNVIYQWRLEASKEVVIPEED